MNLSHRSQSGRSQFDRQGGSSAAVHREIAVIDPWLLVKQTAMITLNAR